MLLHYLRLEFILLILGHHPILDLSHSLINYLRVAHVYPRLQVIVPFKQFHNGKNLPEHGHQSQRPRRNVPRLRVLCQNKQGFLCEVSEISISEHLHEGLHYGQLLKHYPFVFPRGSGPLGLQLILNLPIYQQVVLIHLIYTVVMQLAG